jgi:hypothetical protein
VAYNLLFLTTKTDRAFVGFPSFVFAVEKNIRVNAIFDELLILGVQGREGLRKRVFGSDIMCARIRGESR